MSARSDTPVALITGSARGLGEAMAHALGGLGMRIVLVARSTEDTPNPVSPGSLEHVHSSLAAEAVEATWIRADLSKHDEVERVIAETLSWAGRCDVLINNAVFAPIGPFLDLPPKRWTTAMAVNVVAPAALCRAFGRGMIERGSGLIINIGSVSSVVPLPGYAVFGSTRAAIERMTMAVATEWGEMGIDAYTIRIEELIETVGQQVVRSQNRSGGATTQALSKASQQINRGGRWTAQDFGRAIAWLAEHRPDPGDSRVLTLADLHRLGALPDRES